MMKNLLFLLLSLFILAGCSSESADAAEEAAEAETATEEQQSPPFSEYLTCTPGPDFNDANARKMVDAWNDLEFAEGFGFAAGHAPLEQSSLGGDNKVYWQLFWTDKDAADAAWAAGPSEEFAAWSQEYESVLTCDGENRRGYDWYWPLGEEANWDRPTEWVTYGHYCKYTDENGFENLKKAVGAFNEYALAEEREPFGYAVYFHNGDNPEPYINYDFFWMNYYYNHEDAQAAYARFGEEGSDIQAMFDAAANCEGPNPSNSYQFYPDPDES